MFGHFHDPMNGSHAPSPPVVLLTCGDPAGIGPEVVCSAWAATPAHARARLRVVADPDVLATALAGRRGLPPLPRVPIDAEDPRPSRPDVGDFHAAAGWRRSVHRHRARRKADFRSR